MPVLPPRPEVPAEQRTTGALALRYEDIAQDGRIHLTALADSLGSIAWARLLARHPIADLARTRGVLPILTKLVLVGENETLSVEKPITGDAAFELAHAGAADARRLFLNLWIDLSGERGRTNAPPMPGAGELVGVGSVYGEHIFTSPFAPPGARRITRLAFPGLPEIPAREHDYLAPDTLLSLPEGAAAIDEDLVADAAPLVMGLAHTDSNQHVNSLVYPRLFEEAILRRLAARGLRTGGLLMRRAELAYRRPCFAGETLRVRLRLYERGQSLGAVGLFCADGAPETEPARCYARAELSR